ncbi:protein kinase [Aureococcus anophagefferens]|nr:protein kinase [Aureococcus anophagefferens]
MLRCVALALACASCRASLFASLVETHDDDAPADRREAAATPEAPPSKRDVLAWRSRLERKRACVSSGVGAFYLYHARKAAGTSLRAALQHAAKRSRVDYLETEGLSIARFLGLRSVITVVSLRDPVRRVLSMYWYEHVGWHDGVTHDHEAARARSWADEWVEGSAWKREFEKKHPGNVYVEVENYFTKMLTGWNRDGRGEALGGRPVRRRGS